MAIFIQDNISTAKNTETENSTGLASAPKIPKTINSYNAIKVNGGEVYRTVMVFTKN